MTDIITAIAWATSVVIGFIVVYKDTRHDGYIGMSHVIMFALSLTGIVGLLFLVINIIFGDPWIFYRYKNKC